VYVYVCFEPKCLRDIRLESLYAKRLMILALYIVIKLVYINKDVTWLWTKSEKRVWGDRTSQ
jgi:hypothetical protein